MSYPLIDSMAYHGLCGGGIMLVIVVMDEHWADILCCGSTDLMSFSLVRSRYLTWGWGGHLSPGSEVFIDAFSLE